MIPFDEFLVQSPSVLYMLKNYNLKKVAQNLLPSFNIQILFKAEEVPVFEKPTVKKSFSSVFLCKEMDQHITHSVIFQVMTSYSGVPMLTERHESSIII